MTMSLSQLGKEAERLMLEQIEESIRLQVETAVKLSPVSTEATRPGGPHGELKAGWCLSGSGKHYVISNDVNHTTFQEMGTCYQSGREMLGLRSGRIESDIVGRIRI